MASSLPPPAGEPAWQQPLNMELSVHAGGRQWAYLLIGVIVGAACATFPVIDRRSLTIEGRPEP